MEYKAERAVLPTKDVLERLRYAGIELLMAEENIDKALEISDKNTKLELLDISISISNNIKKLKDLLTCGGRIYDEYSEFLKPKEAEKNE